MKESQLDGAQDFYDDMKEREQAAQAKINKILNPFQKYQEPLLKAKTDEIIMILNASDIVTDEQKESIAGVIDTAMWAAVSPEGE